MGAMTLPALLLSFLVAAGLSVIFVPFARRLALTWGVVAKPGGRHVHAHPTPKLGGLAVAGSFFVVVGAVLLLDPSRLQFVNESVLGIDRNLIGVLLGALILVVTGVVDDRYDLPPQVKLA